MNTNKTFFAYLTYLSAALPILGTYQPAIQFSAEDAATLREMRDKYGRLNDLMSVAITERIDDIRRLLREGANPHQTNENGISAIGLIQNELREISNSRRFDPRNPNPIYTRLRHILEILKPQAARIREETKHDDGRPFKRARTSSDSHTFF